MMAFFRHWRLPRHNRKLLFRCHISLQGLRDAPIGRNTSCSNWSALAAFRGLHSSPALRGLEEFFPKGDVIEEGESAGRQWEARELRQKSNEDLHKLWYVLLKERNMLMTVKHEARRTGFIMPAPERTWKVYSRYIHLKYAIFYQLIECCKGSWVRIPPRAA
ncbi:39S ribosomal protein L47, mitochondrial [Geodia barretti]|uniref:Large ribosomal subunit protein uL29m n=1 Tax=Geodia barretti TaxID=519541 RepID=A0AA35RTX4_GEOBA|nr:39S ribosomal protein L47, mitochondrial [Geodia barretti]